MITIGASRAPPAVTASGNSGVTVDTTSNVYVIAHNAEFDVFRGFLFRPLNKIPTKLIGVLLP